ncbi:MAG: 2-hydroxyglutaryl-CoA dehydratase [Desulfomonile tiedjei]|uniref:2-hydroxyglutaryl-CoA dehydratase n=1 Tax=Desulfomonile tiedjei TaxID=2358 RepID=A0A9D6V313_9BACT|nr:2-hydroxyglutaryl-CoA dehydratase [Desulfomonile tiedjei]
MLVAGVDAGSNTVKIVLIEGGSILANWISKTGPNSMKAVEKGLETILSEHGRALHDVHSIVATGYGRNYIPFATYQATEILCQAKAIRKLIPEAKTIIDIGGQDSKVIYADQNGRVVEFAMNDKCAAGTGRFIETLANALHTPLEDMGALSLKAEGEVQVSSTCTVFAESEVISYIAQGLPKPDIISGVHHAIASRVSAMARRREICKDVCLTGGVAKNVGVVWWMEKELGLSLRVPKEPQITAAIGAALIGLEKASPGSHDVPFADARAPEITSFARGREKPKG